MTKEQAKSQWKVLGISKGTGRITDEGLVSHLLDVGFYSEWDGKERCGLTDVFRKYFGCWAKNRQEARAEIRALRRLLRWENRVASTRSLARGGKKYSYSEYFEWLDVSCERRRGVKNSKVFDLDKLGDWSCHLQREGESRPELPFTEGESNSGVERRTGVWTGHIRLALTVDTVR